MATKLNKAQRDQLQARAETSAAVYVDPRSRPAPPIQKESDLCQIFMRDFNALDDWSCYPEAGGFDVLVVHKDGRQIGVEAKLTLNAKVAEQILPSHGDDLYERPGPDHRIVIVSKITDSNAGIAKMLLRLGVKVIAPQEYLTSSGYQHTFSLRNKLFDAERSGPIYSALHLFDWWPSERCKVPAVISNLPAGVPSPIRLTPWKESALKVLALLRSQGYITGKQVATHGISFSVWTQSHDSGKGWLAKGAERGQWVETERMPNFDKQHPELYAIEVKALAKSLAKAANKAAKAKCN